MSCEDDAFQNRKYPCIARYFTFVSNKEEKLTTSAIFHNSTIWVCILRLRLIDPDPE